jgi:hypothetical protein
MSQTIWLGAVAYKPDVVTIWEGMRRYFHEEAHLPVEVVLFQSAKHRSWRCSPNRSSPCRVSILRGTRTWPTYADEWSSRALLSRGCYARHRSGLDDQDRRSLGALFHSQI